MNGRRAAAVQRVSSLFDARELLKVCASPRWATAMMTARPFASWETMVAHARGIELTDDEWLAAFAAHPRIGDRKPGWSSQEQSGTRSASDETLRALADGNRAYEEKFGFVYLICATGKSADEMLASLQTRIGNDRETEIRNAAEEHRKITELRLEKLVL
jgi:OHCU decarboxylase